MEQAIEMSASTGRRSFYNSNGAGSLPLVSVVIPTHNRSSRLVRAVDSVLRQTYSRLEIIVVDDCSSDNTAEAIARLDDSRIRYVRHDHNLGGAAARNTGIRLAQGEFIAFLDDDDEWEPTKTEEQLTLLRHYPAVVCTTDGIGKDLERFARKKVVELKDLKRGPFGGTGVLMAHASVIKELFFDETLSRGQDWDLFIRIALKYQIGYLNKPLLRYNNGDHRRITNRVREVPPKNLEQEFKVIHKYQSLFGARWARRRLAQGMLYGFRYRRDKMELIIYTAWRCGIINVGRVFLDRAWARWRAYLGPYRLERSSMNDVTPSYRGDR